MTNLICRDNTRVCIASSFRYYMRLLALQERLRYQPRFFLRAMLRTLMQRVQEIDGATTLWISRKRYKYYKKRR